MTTPTPPSSTSSLDDLRERVAPLQMDAATFRRLGHALVDRVAAELASIATRPVVPDQSPAEVRAALGDHRLPDGPTDPDRLLATTADALFEHSLFNGHPRFFGYITSSAAPIGILGELLAAAVNPNVGAWALSPLATEMEAETEPTPLGGSQPTIGNASIPARSRRESKRTELAATSRSWSSGRPDR